MVKPTDPGERDQYITIQKRPTTKAASGADIPAADPEPVISCWAKIAEVPRGGRMEGLMADVLATKTEYTVDIYYVPGIDETMEIAWGTRLLDIIRVVDLGARPLNLLIYAEERR